MAYEDLDVMQYQAGPYESLRVVAKWIFWIGFFCLGAFILLLTRRAFGETSAVAVLMQSAAGVWVLALVLQMMRWRAAYAVAAVWVLMLGGPLAFQIVRRIHHWITIGMDGADGVGSPMVFLFGFVLEWGVMAFCASCSRC